MENKKYCKYCGEQIEKDSIVCPKCGRQLQVVKEKKEKPKEELKKVQKDENVKFYTQDWFMWIMLIFFAPVGIFLMWKYHTEMKKNTKIIISIIFGIIFIVALIVPSDETNNTGDNKQNDNTQQTETKKVEVIDFSSMNETEIISWCGENNLNCKITREYSNTVAKDGFVSQSVQPTSKVSENSRVVITFSLGVEPSAEYKSALKKAESYAKTLHMSKQGIYDQLISEYGEGFTKDAAQYAIDNLEWDWNSNALEKAKSYRDTLNMSKNNIYKQLISNYGEKFTKSEAQYAIDHLDD